MKYVFNLQGSITSAYNEWVIMAVDIESGDIISIQQYLYLKYKMHRNYLW